MLKNWRTLMLAVKNAKDLVGTLKNKTVVEAELESFVLKLTFSDGSILTAGSRSGPGADGNWYNWTDITLNGQTILNE